MRKSLIDELVYGRIEFLLKEDEKLFVFKRWDDKKDNFLLTITFFGTGDYSLNLKSINVELIETIIESRKSKKEGNILKFGSYYGGVFRVKIIEKNEEL